MHSLRFEVFHLCVKTLRRSFISQPLHEMFLHPCYSAQNEVREEGGSYEKLSMIKVRILQLYRTYSKR